MRIGLDFDNTIVRYDSLFHKVALENGLISADLPVNKLAVRNHLRLIGREDDWTEMQGTVYGGRMEEAEMFPGVLDFLHWARQTYLPVFIVSHKTRYPFRGDQHDLHSAARGWVERWLEETIPAERIFFEVTKEEKLARIGACDCQLFLDDLPEILTAASFPTATERLLFDPDGHHGDSEGLTVIPSWAHFQKYVAARCPTNL